MKTCKKCEMPKDLTEFDIKTNGSVSGYCKECRREKIRKHYQENKQYYLDKSKRANRIDSDKYYEYKKTLNCTDCGISFKEEPYLCDFHHIDGSSKLENPGSMKNHFKGFMKEVKKCIPLCANCHRRRHYKLS